MSTDESITEDNQEWQLAELVDAIASEIDHAEDTLSLKSYARGKSLAIKQLNLDLEVTVRRGRDGEIWFRTVVDPKENGATVVTYSRRCPNGTTRASYQLHPLVSAFADAARTDTRVTLLTTRDAPTRRNNTMSSVSKVLLEFYPPTDSLNCFF
ncbi:hypothetical protein BJP36_23620 [Moorena producens JHB]|uniref:Uncharacterized protein n=1 Tax=Moorena producens (strain JHB) TaxID=1454205 RepID=A0A1D9G4W1_MOOP1|nr:hypothetical protein [Moorena producens]AOY82450.1 hypothetical protein BJP36_23620 [Moorena producens JHB]